jgi:hypothetical protein
MGEHREKLAICKSRREALKETKLLNTLILNFQLPELLENIFLLCKPPIWYFIVAVLTN